ncbi:PREDICTED: uncharacterized protein LOC108684723 [Atta colombica]|uniref:uncharacterized protein LOC108684723 n=1 Tax=Atta colombica TaxID=520822 RepID=UPI00084CD854|nr:PREDICTED: uncharacterized protein LOC108684723 [Atta colombica]
MYTSAFLHASYSFLSHTHLGSILYNEQKYNVIDNTNIHCNVSVNAQCTLQSYDSIQLSKCQTSPKVISSVILEHQTQLRKLKDYYMLSIVNCPHLTPPLATPRKARRALQLSNNNNEK